MFISIDKEGLTFLHKHAQRRVVTQLATIEAPHKHVAIFPCDSLRDFNEFTDYELRKLYENTSGIKFPGFYRPGLLNVAFETAQALPESVVNPWEVDRQCAEIDFKDRSAYRYQPGQVKPLKVTDLFNDGLKPLLKRLDETVVEKALHLRELVLPPLPPLPTPPIVPTGPANHSAAPKVYKPPSERTAPRGSGKERVWACADEHWASAGSPTNVSQVLALRKQIMSVLETEGMNRNSVSCELGNWQKARLQTSLK